MHFYPNVSVTYAKLLLVTCMKKRTLSLSKTSFFKCIIYRVQCSIQYLITMLIEVVFWKRLVERQWNNLVACLNWLMINVCIITVVVSWRFYAVLSNLVKLGRCYCSFLRSWRTLVCLWQWMTTCFAICCCQPQQFQGESIANTLALGGKVFKPLVSILSLISNKLSVFLRPLSSFIMSVPRCASTKLG